MSIRTTFNSKSNNNNNKNNLNNLNNSKIIQKNDFISKTWTIIKKSNSLINNNNQNQNFKDRLIEFENQENQNQNQGQSYQLNNNYHQEVDDNIIDNTIDNDNHDDNDDKDDKDDDDDDDDDDDEINQSLELNYSPVHQSGIPSCSTQLIARKYKTYQFKISLFEMLRDQLALIGWSNLPQHYQSSILINKVTGSLTNAVFFVSCPFKFSNDHSIKINDNFLTPDPPTVLLRIYGPSSGSLISRKEELHLLHTLSAKYGIGPSLLGTFYNGRVEQFIKSCPLTNHQIRQPRISRWIARNMSQLHSVDLSVLSTNLNQQDRSRSNPIIHSNQNFKSDGFTWKPFVNRSNQLTRASCSSNYSTDSDLSIQNKFNSDRILISSPQTYHTPSVPSISDPSDLQSFSLGPSSLPIKIKSKPAGVWVNITRWQHTATKVFSNILETLQTFQVDAIHDLLTNSQDSQILPISSSSPLFSPKTLRNYVEMINLPRLIIEMKTYRAWTRTYEKINGRNPRVFCHNDTQCGNLLLRQDDDGWLNQQPHEQIMVIDFEYASPNPRGFDIANHFHEWCADYHHPTLSHSLTSHGQYPTFLERRRFYRAYLGIDLGYDGSGSNDPRWRLESPFLRAQLNEEEIAELSLDDQKELEDESMVIQQEREDVRVMKLEEEIKVWSPASHAMWALWGIIQARDDINVQLTKWQSQDLSETDEFEFDYLSYSLERIILFRKLLIDLHVPI